MTHERARTHACHFHIDYSPLRRAFCFKMQQAPVEAACPKVCIFDIDNTLTVGQQHDEARCALLPNTPPPAWPSKGSGATAAIKAAVQACVDGGYKLAIASAETASEQLNQVQLNFLKSIHPSIDDAFLQSPAFMGSWSLLSARDADTHVDPHDGGGFGIKQAMYFRALQHYEVPKACWRDSIVFDDQMENLAAAHALGLKTIQASPECGGVYCDRGCGLTEGSAALIKGFH